MGSACGVRKTVPKGEKILTKNKFEVESDRLIDYNISNEIQSQVLYKPNRRVFLGRVPFFLWLYSFGTKSKAPELSDSKKWRKSLRKQGEPPVLLDTSKIILNVSNIQNYLFNNGYFRTKVDYSVKIKGHKAIVKYIAKPEEAFIINDFFIQSKDTQIQKLVTSICDSLRQESNIFTPKKGYARISAFTQARKEIAKRVRNKGYYAFDDSYINLELDTAYLLGECKVYLNIARPAINTNHQRYTFASPTLTIDVGDSYLNKKKWPQETTYANKRLVLNHYPINPSTIAKLIYTDSNALFNQTSIEQTYQSLLEMELFNYVDVRATPDTLTHQVRVYIYCRALHRLGFKWEPQGLYSPQGNLGATVNSNQRSFGMAMLLGFSDRNLFGNGEKLTLGSITSAEAIFKRDNINDLRYGLQQGFNASLVLPHFNLLNKLTSRTQFHTRKTIISASYQFEENPSFKRRTIPAGITFQFQKPGLSLLYTPLEISYLNSTADPAFLASLNAVNAAFATKVLFTPLFIAASKIGFVQSNSLFKRTDNNLYLRAAIETSGNALRWLSALNDPNFSSNRTYSIFGVQLSRYVRGEFEMRFKKDIDELNTVAFKVNTGIGIPFGNGESNVLPYDKRFFIGGSNSLRGWRPRRLGPGDEPTSNNIIDKAGELLIEASTEYRFTLLKDLFYGAIFADAGNIWNVNHKNTQVGTKGIFDPDTYLQEMAFNTGIGARFDFGFFLFRLDWGWPLHDPTKQNGSRWLLDNMLSVDYIENETAITIGIGYPF